MLSYCLKCRQNTESNSPKAVKTKNRRVMILSDCVVSNSEKWRLKSTKLADYY